MKKNMKKHVKACKKPYKNMKKYAKHMQKYNTIPKNDQLTQTEEFNKTQHK